MKYKISMARLYLAVIIAIALIFFSCNVTKKKEAAPSTNTKQTQQSTEQTPKASKRPEASTDAEKAKQEKITALQHNCTGFSGTYDYGRFSNEKDDTIRFLELKCAQARGDDLKLIKDADGANLLHSAAAKGDLDSVKFLIETAGIDVNSKDSSTEYTKAHTAIAHAAENDHLAVVKYLINKGANKKDFNIYIQTIRNGHLDIIKYLIECARVDVNLKEFSKQTLLFKAAFDNQLEIVKYLMSKGANATTQDLAGQTACDVVNAEKYEQTEKDALIQAMNNCTAAPKPKPALSCLL